VPERDLQLFGGDWTEQKLAAVRKYLGAYTIALSKQKFELSYIDAFAGTGYRERRSSRRSEEQSFLAEEFKPLMEDETQKFLDGSATLALKTEPSFHRYVFIELLKKKVAELEKLRVRFPEKAARIEIVQGDANIAIQSLCAKWDQKRSRGVLFLDPFGMQADWATVDAVARTRTIDVWILFPFGANRLLTKRASDIRPQWRDRLTKLFGTESWYARFYEEQKIQGFFGESSTISKRLTLEVLGAFYHERLKSIFPKVAPNPRVLYNSKDVPLFELFFAAGNPGVGGDLALRIAEHILGHI
jgi:three-Cys-motif partner protein